MVSTLKSPPVKAVSPFDDFGAQFRGLNPQEPGQWPILPKALAWVAVFVVILVGAWFFVLSDSLVELEAERGKETTLKADYTDKLAQAINLEELRRQKTEVEKIVEQLERQLPGKAEMDALLSDINKSGLGRGLQFESFKPGEFVPRRYYGEKLIAIVVTGNYHDFGAFAADIANLSRIVTLDGMAVTASNRPGGRLQMTATARAYRYLDESEIQKARQDAMAAKGGAQ